MVRWSDKLFGRTRSGTFTGVAALVSVPAYAERVWPPRTVLPS